MTIAKQKFLITSTKAQKAQREVDEYLEDGWRIISVTARSASTGSEVNVHGSFGILFEKFFPDENL